MLVCNKLGAALKENGFSELERHLLNLMSEMNQHKSSRKILIKNYEQQIGFFFQNDFIDLLERKGFEVIGHQPNRWLYASNGNETLKAWFLFDANTVQHEVSILYKRKRYKLNLLVKHKFSSVENNYLSFDYQKELRSRILRLEVQLRELKTLKLTDIDGSYVSFFRNEENENNVKFNTLETCFKTIIAGNTDEDT